MALYDELLEQAEHLIDFGAPNQATYRRGISTAYYALFHLLITEAIRTVGNDLRLDLQARMRRAFAHSDMALVCRQFDTSNFSPALRSLVSTPIEPDLKLLAKDFITLQEMRLTADYDLSSDVDVLDAASAYGMVDRAFERWSRIKNTPNTTVFLTALLLGRHWNR